MEFISATQEPYFIGSLILKQGPTNSGSEVDRRVIIDGQHGLKRYATGLETLAKYLDFDIWNERAIEDRAGGFYANSSVMAAIWRSALDSSIETYVLKTSCYQQGRPPKPHFSLALAPAAREPASRRTGAKVSPWRHLSGFGTFPSLLM